MDSTLAIEQQRAICCCLSPREWSLRTSLSFRTLSFSCGTRNPPPSSGARSSPAQLAERSLINRFLLADCRSEPAPILIGITSERLSTSVQNRYRHQLGMAIAIARNPHASVRAKLEAAGTWMKRVLKVKGEMVTLYGAIDREEISLIQCSARHGIWRQPSAFSVARSPL
jgi:hypothetical protein